MSDERPWEDDAKGLAKGSTNLEEIIDLINAAGDHAKKGDFNAAAESLESVRSKLVAAEHFQRYDNDTSSSAIASSARDAEANCVLFQERARRVSGATVLR